MDTQYKIHDLDREVILTNKEMVIIDAIRKGKFRLKEMSDFTGYSQSHLKYCIKELKEMDWVLWNNKKQRYEVNEEYRYKVVQIRNGTVCESDEKVIKNRMPIKATFERRNIRHTPAVVKTYYISPEEAKQRFIELTRHMPHFEFKKGVFTPNENYRSPQDTRRTDCARQTQI